MGKLAIILQCPFIFSQSVCVEADVRLYFRSMSHSGGKGIHGDRTPVVRLLWCIIKRPIRTTFAIPWQLRSQTVTQGLANKCSRSRGRQAALNQSIPLEQSDPGCAVFFSLLVLAPIPCNPNQLRLYTKKESTSFLRNSGSREILLYVRVPIE